mgnify:CR=1 FL=1
MTDNQIVALLAPLISLGTVLWIVLARRRAKKKTLPKKHAPHRPNAGNDSVASARSKMIGDGSVEN